MLLSVCFSGCLHHPVSIPIPKYVFMSHAEGQSVEQQWRLFFWRHKQRHIICFKRRQLLSISTPERRIYGTRSEGVLTEWCSASDSVSFHVCNSATLITKTSLTINLINNSSHVSIVCWLPSWIADEFDNVCINIQLPQLVMHQWIPWESSHSWETTRNSTHIHWPAGCFFCSQIAENSVGTTVPWASCEHSNFDLWMISAGYLSHTIHVWYIYLPIHLGIVCGKCR